MNRLTRRNGAGSAIPNNGFGGLTNSAGQQIINALAAYEDTGLTPEEVAELAKAKADGRLVVLPCKVGDTVYFIREEYTGNNSIQSNEVFEIKLDSRGVVFYGVPRRCSMDFMCYIEDIGKTVFLTRAEAEEALKGGTA